jgi:nucleoside-diphosphate-sugar epimerase
MRALVTGGTGFTGGHLAGELRTRGWEVRALARPRSNVDALLEHGVEVHRGELTSRRDVIAAANGADVIFHVAAAYREARHPDRYYEDVNVGGTEHVLAAAEEHGARLVHCSTGGVHGHIRSIPADEDAPLNPGDIYQQTKLEGEMRVQEAIRRGLPASVVRPAAIYGPGDLRMLKLFRMVHNRTFRMFGGGMTRYHLVYISDLVEGMILCATRPEALGRTYLLAGPRHTALNELVMLVARAVGAPPPRGSLPLWPLVAAARGCEWVCRPLGIEPPLHVRRVDFFRKDRAFSIERARREIGYEPRVDPAEGLARTAAWYFEQKLLARRTSGGEGAAQSHGGGALAAAGEKSP